ncbi:hypothetical protein [Vibrio panuliri]|uniref:Zinc finger/thioredoxin putative domain-containing protein n=1 Tax=Vibrio panuliri TaxID=1381081 RepID=A0ABX3FFV5_9VIBR|nr:hypothetical protein [Vibrio panuliri]KAB1457397.1 hypothetical protein F7O85_06550 [Vibrio panuliri]OLQ91441.1 hypothetical protein BIY20_01130 [Vibrio panuliri]
MAKYPNPVRGFIRCPVCQKASTVHQVGEGQLIETGEPPKNSRNIGLKYYRCPDCGNSAISKSGSSYIDQHVVEHESDLPTVGQTEVQPEVTENQPEKLTENATLVTEELTEQEGELIEAISATDSVTEIATKANNDKVSSAKETEKPNTMANESKPWLKKTGMVLLMLFFLVWAIRQLMPKTEGVTENKESTDHA